jgi:hypothetical protein
MDPVADPVAADLRKGIDSLENALVYVTQAAQRRKMHDASPAYRAADQADKSANAALDAATTSLESAKAAQSKATELSKKAEEDKATLDETARNEINAVQQAADSTLKAARTAEREAKERVDRVSAAKALLKTVIDAKTQGSVSAERLSLLAEEIRDVLARVQDETFGGLSTGLPDDESESPDVN